MRLLLVDDEDSLLQLLGQHLVRNGHTVESAASFADGANLSGGGFDAAILDWTLPDGNGLDLGMAIMRQHPQIKVVFTSGYPLDFTLVPLELRPRVRLLQKPFLPRALGEILNSL